MTVTKKQHVDGFLNMGAARVTVSPLATTPTMHFRTIESRRQFHQQPHQAQLQRRPRWVQEERVRQRAAVREPELREKQRDAYRISHQIQSRTAHNTQQRDGGVLSHLAQHGLIMAEGLERVLAMVGTHAGTTDATKRHATMSHMEQSAVDRDTASGRVLNDSLLLHLRPRENVQTQALLARVHVSDCFIHGGHRGNLVSPQPHTQPKTQPQAGSPPVKSTHTLATRATDHQDGPKGFLGHCRRVQRQRQHSGRNVAGGSVSVATAHDLAAVVRKNLGRQKLCVRADSTKRSTRQSDEPQWTGAGNGDRSQSGRQRHPPERFPGRRWRSPSCTPPGIDPRHPCAPRRSPAQCTAAQRSSSGPRPAGQSPACVTQPPGHATFAPWKTIHTVRLAAKWISASSHTNTGFLPPSSRVTGVRCSDTACHKQVPDSRRQTEGITPRTHTRQQGSEYLHHKLADSGTT